MTIIIPCTTRLSLLAVIAVIGLLPVVFLTSCGPAEVEPKSTVKPEILTTFYPTLYFIERIAGAHVDASCPLPDDADPIFWKPDTATIQKYQEADLIVINGAGFEKWIEKATLPPSKLVDTAKSFKSEFIQYKDSVTHSHGPSGEHAHEGIDGHTWLDPVHARAQAQAIHDALLTLLPDDRMTFQEGFQKLERELQRFDTGLREIAKALGEQTLLCSHPAYNYIARRYGWNIINLDLDPETMPSAEAIASIKTRLEKTPAKILLWESAPTPAIAERLEKELGLRSVVFSPCELLGVEEIAAGKNYRSIMLENIATLKQTIERK